jgi:hypothetical protein
MELRWRRSEVEDWRGGVLNRGMKKIKRRKKRENVGGDGGK